MKITIIDGQGGGLGKLLVEKVRREFPEAEIAAVGANSMATGQMLKAGASYGATGENAVVVACRKADVIIGPVGIVIADALLGEVTPTMAKAVGQSEAVRILLPSDKCDTFIAGVGSAGMSALVEDAMDKLASLLK